MNRRGKEQERRAAEKTEELRLGWLRNWRPRRTCWKKCSALHQLGVLRCRKTCSDAGRFQRIMDIQCWFQGQLFPVGKDNAFEYAYAHASRHLTWIIPLHSARGSFPHTLSRHSHIVCLNVSKLNPCPSWLKRIRESKGNTHYRTMIQPSSREVVK